MIAFPGKCDCEYDNCDYHQKQTGGDSDIPPSLEAGFWTTFPKATFLAEATSAAPQSTCLLGDRIFFLTSLSSLLSILSYSHWTINFCKRDWSHGRARRKLLGIVVMVRDKRRSGCLARRWIDF